MQSQVLALPPEPTKSPAEWKANYEAKVDEALAKAWFAETSARAQNAGWTTDYMNRVRRVAARLDIPLADGYARWEAARRAGVDTDTLLANGANHPNAAGHHLLAEALLKILDLNFEQNQ